MAGAAEIARRTAAAQRELTAALEALSERFGVPTVQVEGIRYRRDAAYERMLRWQALARWAQMVAEAATEEVRPNGAEVRGVLEALLSGLSKTKLLAFAAEHGVTLDAEAGKAELVAQAVEAWLPDGDA